MHLAVRVEHSNTGRDAYLRYRLTLALGALALAACSDYGYDAAVNPGVTPGDPPGAVYTLTNRPTGNELVVFRRAVDGTLTVVNTVPTDGSGTGAGLSSAGSPVLTEDNQLFSLTPDPVLVDRVDSDDELPVSIAVRGRLVYVLNAGERVTSPRLCPSALAAGWHAQFGGYSGLHASQVAPNLSAIWHTHDASPT